MFLCLFSRKPILQCLDRYVVHILGNFPQLVSTFMNWRKRFRIDSLQLSLQISERL